MNFKLINVKICKSDELKGYITGSVVIEDDAEYNFLYRIHDPKNGNENELVSIDYGYENEKIIKLWEEIEKYIYNNYCVELETPKAPENIKIDLWYDDIFQPKKYHADAYFTPGNGYAGNIYNNEGKTIGDYTTDDSVIISQNFIIKWCD